MRHLSRTAVVLIFAFIAMICVSVASSQLQLRVGPKERHRTTVVRPRARVQIRVNTPRHRVEPRHPVRRNYPRYDRHPPERHEDRD